MKLSKLSLQFEALTLRPLAETDLVETLSWRNHVDNRIWFHDSSVLTLEQHRSFFCSYLKKDNDFIFIIEDPLKNKIGQASIYRIDRDKKNAEFGRFLVNPEYRGQGFMKKSCFALLDFARAYLNLQEIHLEVKERNERAIRIYQDAGFFVSNKKEDIFFMKNILENKE